MLPDMGLMTAGVTASGFKISEVVCGLAKGADLLGKLFAEVNGYPCKDFPADWNKYGRAAGPIRNKQMADYADAAIVFMWDNSRGSKNMIETMQKLGKPVYVVNNGVIA